MSECWPPTPTQIYNITNQPVTCVHLYQQAFVHRSAVKSTGLESNERLEFLGDAVISLAVNHSLFDQFPCQREGHLTRLKTKLVSGTCLAGLADRLGLHRYITMNKKALEEGWSHNSKIMEDCLEALTGALYIDQGFLAAKAFILNLLATHIDYHNLAIETNGKDMLMFYTQQNKIDLPEYRLIPVNPDSKIKFAVQTFVGGQSVGIGTGLSKKEAEMVSARVALETLGVPQEQPRSYFK